MKTILALPIAFLLAWLHACDRRTEETSADPVRSLLEEGQEAFTKGQYDLALQAYARALQKEPRSALIHNLMGMAYRFKYNQLHSPDLKEKEIAFFKKAVELDSRFIPALVNLGSTYYFADRKKEAAEQLRRVLEIMPTHPEAEQLRKMIAEAGAVEDQSK